MTMTDSSLFELLDIGGHDRVVLGSDQATGLHAVIAIHSTTRGPALGGCRMLAYSDEVAAINDALRLSRAMSYKAAISDLPFGGGKSVILARADSPKTPDLLAAFGRLVDSLQGQYLVTEDVGITAADIAHVRTATPYVTLAENDQDPANDGNYMTALGVSHGIRAALEHVTGSPDLTGRRIAIQGLGQVGRALARLLHDGGADLIVTDLDDHLVQQIAASTGASVLPPEKILAADCDVLAPCALGGVINEATRDQVRARIVAGAANNILADTQDGQALHERGIAYAPDYVVNAGGIIWEAGALAGWGTDATRARIERIAHTVRRVFDHSEKTGLPPAEAADQLAELALGAPAS